jgi:hypothetical protein
MNSQPLWLVAAILTTFFTFALSTQSPLMLILVAVYLSSIIIPSRLPRDAATVWGIRLFALGACVVLARAMPVGRYSYFDARGFIHRVWYWALKS